MRVFIFAGIWRRQCLGGREHSGDTLAVDFVAMNSFLFQKPVLSKARTLMPRLLLTMYLALQRP